MILVLALVAAPVTVSSLLAEMADLDRLMKPAEYTAAQASSYDRASKSPAVEWFANGDAGKFLRTEGKEHVMADLKGPGAVVRVWSANPDGVIRFYFDGETKPRLEAPMADLLRGKTQPFGDEFAYEAARGCNLYFPFPYAKSLKITAEGPVGGLYYQIGYRTYPDRTVVDSFHGDELQKSLARPLEVLSKVAGPWNSSSGELQRNQSLTLHEGGSGIVRELQVRPSKLDPASLRSLILTMKVDGELTVVAPLGDFFGSAPGIVPNVSLPMTVEKDGTMTCRFPMPFERKAEISIQNRGRVPISVSMKSRVDKVRDVPPLRFHAQWSYDRGNTRPMRDLNVLNARGAGRFVGVFLHVENPTPAWWGEGDEKIFVDGETFPSTFGTGTEDYFGYAWCSPILFQRPYHGQPRCDGPGNFGHTANYRWQTFDDIPFTTSLKFDLEMWHWAVVEATWARTAFWYATPGSTGNKAITTKMPISMQSPNPVVGAIEGEGLEVLEVTGGTHEAQEGFWELSGQKQRWWMDAKVGDRLVLKLPVAAAGTYELIANICHAKDYGIHEIRLNGKRLAQIDFYSDGLGWKKESLGTVTLDKGDSKLEVICKGHNGRALPRRMFGLDYLILKKR